MIRKYLDVEKCRKKYEYAHHGPGGTFSHAASCCCVVRLVAMLDGVAIKIYFPAVTGRCKQSSLFCKMNIAGLQRLCDIDISFQIA